MPNWTWDAHPRFAKAVDEILASHEARLHKVLDLCAIPTTIVNVTSRLFGPVTGYNAFLALEEAGAHIEQLYLHGELAAANLDKVENTEQPVVRYHRAWLGA